MGIGCKCLIIRFLVFLGCSPQSLGAGAGSGSGLSAMPGGLILNYG